MSYRLDSEHGQSFECSSQDVAIKSMGSFFMTDRYQFCIYYGPELRAVAFTEWCESKGIELKYIQPGKPQQNAFIERFDRTYRHEVLNAYLFDDLDYAREITEAWIRSYNEERPHGALGKLPPKSFRLQAENYHLHIPH